MSLIIILIILLLLIMAGFISAAETAITATSPGRMQQLKQKHDKRANLVLRILKTKDKVISTLLIGNSIANTLCTTLATSIFIDMLGDDMGTIVSSAVMAFVIIVFSEVVPKAIAVAKAESLALIAAPLLIVFIKILHPVNVMLGYIVKLFCLLFRIDMKQEISGTEEVRGVIEHQLQEGNVFKNDRNMLGGVLDIRHMVIADIMTHRSKIVSINIDLSIEEILKLAISSYHSRIPIWKNNQDNIVGILHTRDLLDALYQQLNQPNGNMQRINIQDLLSEPWFIPDNALVTKQLDAFRVGQSHIACVVDEYGDLQGIITLEDILEEVFGQIYDEFDQANNKIIHHQDNEYMIDGSVSIRDLNRELDWNIPEEDATTIAGFLINKMERLPHQGEYLDYNNIRFTIVGKSSNRIKIIKAHILESSQQEEQE